MSQEGHTGELSVVADNLRVAAKRQKSRYDRKAKPFGYKIGQLVWYYYPPAAIGKLSRGWLGPVKIIGQPTDVNVVIQTTPNGKKRRIHIDHLKPYLGPTPENWQSETENPEGLAVEDEVSDANLTDDEEDDSAERFRRSRRQRRAPARLDL